MTTENPITPDVINRQIQRSNAPPPGLGRRERRAFERALARAKGREPSATITEVHQLTPIVDLIEEQEISVYTSLNLKCKFKQG